MISILFAILFTAYLVFLLLTFIIPPVVSPDEFASIRKKKRLTQSTPRKNSFTKQSAPTLSVSPTTPPIPSLVTQKVDSKLPRAPPEASPVTPPDSTLNDNVKLKIRRTNSLRGELEVNGSSNVSYLTPRRNSAARIPQRNSGNEILDFNPKIDQFPKRERSSSPNIVPSFPDEMNFENFDPSAIKQNIEEEQSMREGSMEKISSFKSRNCQLEETLKLPSDLEKVRLPSVRDLRDLFEAKKERARHLSTSRTSIEPRKKYKNQMSMEEGNDYNSKAGKLYEKNINDDISESNSSLKYASFYMSNPMNLCRSDFRQRSYVPYFKNIRQIFERSSSTPTGLDEIGITSNLIKIKIDKFARSLPLSIDDDDIGYNELEDNLNKHSEETTKPQTSSIKDIYGPTGKSNFVSKKLQIFESIILENKLRTSFNETTMDSQQTSIKRATSNADLRKDSAKSIGDVEIIRNRSYSHPNINRKNLDEIKLIDDEYTEAKQLQENAIKRGSIHNLKSLYENKTTISSSSSKYKELRQVSKTNELSDNSDKKEEVKESDKIIEKTEQKVLEEKMLNDSDISLDSKSPITSVKINPYLKRKSYQVINAGSEFEKKKEMTSQTEIESSHEMEEKQGKRIRRKSSVRLIVDHYENYNPANYSKNEGFENLDKESDTDAIKIKKYKIKPETDMDRDETKIKSNQVLVNIKNHVNNINEDDSSTLNFKGENERNEDKRIKLDNCEVNSESKTDSGNVKSTAVVKGKNEIEINTIKVKSKHVETSTNLRYKVINSPAPHLKNNNQFEENEMKNILKEDEQHIIYKPSDNKINADIVTDAIKEVRENKFSKNTESFEVKKVKSISIENQKMSSLSEKIRHDKPLEKESSVKENKQVIDKSQINKKITDSKSMKNEGNTPLQGSKIEIVTNQTNESIDLKDELKVKRTKSVDENSVLFSNAVQSKNLKNEKEYSTESSKEVRKSKDLKIQVITKPCDSKSELNMNIPQPKEPFYKPNLKPEVSEESLSQSNVKSVPSKVSKYDSNINQAQSTDYKSESNAKPAKLKDLTKEKLFELKDSKSNEKSTETKDSKLESHEKPSQSKNPLSNAKLLESKVLKSESIEKVAQIKDSKSTTEPTKSKDSMIESNEKLAQPKYSKSNVEPSEKFEKPKDSTSNAELLGSKNSKSEPIKKLAQTKDSNSIVKPAESINSKTESIKKLVKPKYSKANTELAETKDSKHELNEKVAEIINSKIDGKLSESKDSRSESNKNIPQAKESTSNKKPADSNNSKSESNKKLAQTKDSKSIKISPELKDFKNESNEKLEQPKYSKSNSKLAEKKDSNSESNVKLAQPKDSISNEELLESKNLKSESTKKFVQRKDSKSIEKLAELKDTNAESKDKLSQTKDSKSIAKPVESNDSMSESNKRIAHVKDFKPIATPVESNVSMSESNGKLSPAKDSNSNIKPVESKDSKSESNEKQAQAKNSKSIEKSVESNDSKSESSEKLAHPHYSISNVPELKDSKSESIQEPAQSKDSKLKTKSESCEKLTQPKDTKSNVKQVETKDSKPKLNAKPAKSKEFESETNENLLKLKDSKVKEKPMESNDSMSESNIKLAHPTDSKVNAKLLGLKDSKPESNERLSQPTDCKSNTKHTKENFSKSELNVKLLQPTESKENAKTAESRDGKPELDERVSKLSFSKENAKQADSISQIKSAESKDFEFEAGTILMKSKDSKPHVKLAESKHIKSESNEKPVKPEDSIANRKQAESKNSNKKTVQSKDVKIEIDPKTALPQTTDTKSKSSIEDQSSPTPPTIGKTLISSSLSESLSNIPGEKKTLRKLNEDEMKFFQNEGSFSQLKENAEKFFSSPQGSPEEAGNFTRSSKTRHSERLPKQCRDLHSDEVRYFGLPSKEKSHNKLRRTLSNADVCTEAIDEALKK